MLASTLRHRSTLFTASIVAAAALVAVMALVTLRLRSKEGAAQDPTQGVMSLKLALGSIEGETPSYVGYVVKSGRGTVLATGSIPVHDAKAPLSVDVPLAPAKGNTLAVFTTTTQDGKPHASFLGTKTFDVVPGQPTRVDLGTVTVGAPARGAGASGAVNAQGAEAPSATTTPLAARTTTESETTCQACELATEQGRCDRDFLSARSEDPPSWGCGTLGTPNEQSACTALLHCLNVADCTQAGNPFVGCFCGGAPVAACAAGVGVSGDCIDQYRAAAEAAGGPAKDAPIADVARYLSTVATNPRTPVGLADNIKECAGIAHCDSCNTL